MKHFFKKKKKHHRSITHIKIRFRTNTKSPNYISRTRKTVNIIVYIHVHTYDCMHTYTPAHLHTYRQRETKRQRDKERRERRDVKCNSVFWHTLSQRECVGRTVK